MMNNLSNEIKQLELKIEIENKEIQEQKSLILNEHKRFLLMSCFILGATAASYLLIRPLHAKQRLDFVSLIIRLYSFYKNIRIFLFFV